MAHDPIDLDELRRLYAGGGGADIHDPHFRDVAGLQFKSGDKRRWPFAQPSTLLDAPYIAGGLAPETLDTLDVALIGGKSVV